MMKRFSTAEAMFPPSRTREALLFPVIPSRLAPAGRAPYRRDVGTSARIEMKFYTLVGYDTTIYRVCQNIYRS